MAILNASPQNIKLGTKDESTRPLIPEAPAIPQHLPKGYGWYRKGPTKPMLVTGAQALELYGTESFDKTSPYFTHTTLFQNIIFGQANNQMLHRMKPSDAGSEANIRIYLDIIQDDVPNYLRNSDGSLVPDGNGGYETDDDEETIDGYRVKVITEYYPDGIDMGQGTMKDGTMTKSDDEDTKSTMIPIMDFKAKWFGEYYNNVGITMVPAKNDEVPSSIFTDAKVFPYFISIITRKDRTSTPTVVKSKFGEMRTLTSIKRGAVNPLTEAQFDLDVIFPENWSNETDPLMPLIYSDFEDVYVYFDNIKDILSRFMEYEKDHISAEPVEWEDGGIASTLSWFDFNTDDSEALTTDELFLLNGLTGRSSKNVRYFTVVMDDGDATLTDTQKEVEFSTNIPIYLNGGSDGSLTEEELEKAIVVEMDKYLDPDSELQDTAINVESILYDSGFTIDTKKALCNFIGLRKDTFVVLGTYEYRLGTYVIPLSDERAIAVLLKTRLQMTPESDYFGTPVMRGMVVAGSGILKDDSIKNRIPATIEIAYKAARYMGAGDGKWKEGYSFDLGGVNVLEVLKDYEPSFIPAGVKPALWDAGIVWAQPKDRRQYHFPAMQTVYEDDTSVLNSFFTAMAITWLNKVADEVWRNFTGSDKLTNDQLAEAVTTYYMDRIKGAFDNRFNISANVLFTPQDLQRGYSWTLEVDIEAANMKTVMTTYITARRKEN